MIHPARPALLALHTTEPEGSVALGDAGKIESRPLATGGPQAPALLAGIMELLATAGSRLDLLGGVVVSCGPGSFTGIRVGLATAQGLAAARGWRVHACDSLLARAAAWAGRPGPLAVVLDARRGEVYAALYEMDSFPPRERVAPFCAPPEEAAGRLAMAAPPALTGSGAELLRGHLPGAVVLSGSPRPVAVALLDLAWGGGCRLLPPHAVEPAYLRKSDAEVRREHSAPPIP